MTERPVIAEGECALEKATGGGWLRLAVLPGGAGALLPLVRSIDAGSLEMAIEVAQDWCLGGVPA